MQIFFSQTCHGHHCIAVDAVLFAKLDTFLTPFFMDLLAMLINCFPSSRLSKAFTNQELIIKTEYILRYMTDQDLRRTVQRNKGECPT